MNKLLLPLFLMITSFVFGQGTPFPGYQQMTNSTTKLQVMGGVQASKGLINGTFTDTATANSSTHIDFYPGAQIYTTDKQMLWLRNNTATRWLPMGIGVTTITFLTDSTMIICYGNGVCDTISFINNIFVTNNDNSVTVFNDSTLIICSTPVSGPPVCDTISFNIDSINNYYFLNDSTIVACDTVQVITVGDSSYTQQLCDTINIPRRTSLVLQNGLQFVAPGIGEFGHSSPDPNPSQLQKDTYLYTDFFNFGISGAPYLRPTLSVQNKQWTQISSSITSFNSLGGNPYQFLNEPDNENRVNLYVNYINRIIEGNGVFSGDTIGQMYDRIGYALMTNAQGTRAGYDLQSTTAKQSGIMFHTFDTQYTDAVTIFGNQTPNRYLFSVSPFPTTTLLDSRIAVFKTGGQVQLPEYTTTTSFVGTVVGVIGFDSDGNLLTTTASGSGTVTSFSAGTLSPLFTTSVATATTTPALTFSLSNAAARTVFGNATSSSGAPSYTTNPVTSTFGLAGSSSGVITIQPQAAAGTYNFNLPTTAGTAGQVLTSQGGGATAMTWTAAGGSNTDSLFGVLDNLSTGDRYFDGSGDAFLLELFSTYTIEAGSFNVFNGAQNRLTVNATQNQIISANGDNLLTMDNGFTEILVGSGDYIKLQEGASDGAFTIQNGVITIDATNGIYASTIPYNSGAGIVALGIDTVAISPTFGQIVRKTASGDGGVTTMATIGSSPNANGASISGVTLTLQPASASFGGVVNTTVQAFAGVKNFTEGIQATGVSYAVQATSANAAIIANNSSTSTNTVVDAIYLQRNGVYNGAAGNGLGITFFPHSDDGSVLNSGQISNFLSTTTLGAEVSQYNFTGRNAGSLFTLMTLSGSGLMTLGITGSNTGRLGFAGVTSGLITIQPASAAGTYTLTLPTDDGDASEVLTTDGNGVLSWEPAGGGTSTWNGITDPTGDQTLTFGAGESSTWIDANTTEDLFTVNSSTGTTNSMFSLNRTGTALAAGNNIMELISSGANGTNAITATGLRISVTNTNATSGTNTALSLTASGATTANNAINVTAGRVVLPAGSSTVNSLIIGSTGLYEYAAAAGGFQIYESGITRLILSGQYGMAFRDASTFSFDVGNAGTLGNVNRFRITAPAVGTMQLGMESTQQSMIFKGANNAGTDAAGFNMTLQPGAGTGNSTSAGTLIFSTPDATGSGTTVQSFTTKFTVGRFGGVWASREAEAQGADVASVAGAIAVGTDGNAFEITGTNAITLISNVNWQNGAIITLLFTSTASLTDGTANSGTDIGMELAGNTNFTGSAGATLTLRLMELGGTQRWYEIARSVQ